MLLHSDSVLQYVYLSWMLASALPAFRAVMTALYCLVLVRLVLPGLSGDPIELRLRFPHLLPLLHMLLSPPKLVFVSFQVIATSAHRATLFMWHL